ncbi:hypothetical protein, partial [Sporolactobacillus shoreae]|uniref:hypothetical protein n=1 Tax=Sporolactobacillus shoreae TaxID=1465501 RepID=UPI0014332373
VTKESGGDPNAVQRIVDINSLQGHPAQGILQYIPRTFEGWMRAGYGNIRGALDQFLAMFDDSNWLKDIQAPGGWGPTGVRRFAYGGQALGPSLVGEAGKSELMRLSDGSLVLSPAQATLINFKKPADILGGDKTEKLLKLLPHYATGTRREWVKGYTRSDGTKVAGYWRTVKVSSSKKSSFSKSKSKSSKPAKRSAPKKSTFNYSKMISDKIGTIIADYRSGKISAASEKSRLQSLEKYSKTTASQRNRITNTMATARNQYNALVKKFDSLGSKIVSNYRSSKQSQSSEQNELSMINELKRGNKLTESWYTKIYNQMTSAVNLQSLNTSVQSSAQTYLNAVKSAVSTMNGVIDSAKQTVYGTWGLLDAPTSSTSTVTSGSGLVANLKAQDTQLSQFKAAIAKLRSRKVNSSLVDELEALGPNSLAEIQNIAGLSNGMLSQYQSLWSQKNSLSYAVGADMSHSAVTTAQSTINQATAAFNASIAADKKKYYQNGFTIAQSTLSGIQKGFEGVGSVLGNTISAIGKSLYNLVNKDLGIKVTKHAVGGFTFGEQLSWLSENNQPEVVLPLTDKTRSVQLINQALSFMGLNGSRSAPKTDQGSLNQLLSAQQDTNTLLATLAQIFVNKQFTLGTPQAASQLEPY